MTAQARGIWRYPDPYGKRPPKGGVMHRTIVDPRFRDLLRNTLMVKGIQPAALGRRANVSRSHVSELINGTKNPSEQTARALDAALDLHGELADLVTITGSPEDLDHLAAVATNPRRTDPAALEALSRVLAAQRHADDLMGSQSVIGATAAQMHTITTMACEARGAARQDVLYVAAQWAQFIGWLSLSVGKTPEAQGWLGRALQWCIEIDHADLTATVLSYQAHAAWLTLEFGTSLGLAHAALRDTSVYPGQRAYDAYQAARNHALVGELNDADRMLGQADKIAAESDAYTGEVPVWQYYRAPWYWQLERGLVHQHMAKHESRHAAPAVEDLTAGLDGMPAGMRGADWAAEYRVHLARAQILAGQRDAARVSLAEARRVAEITQSKRVMRLVQGCEHRLAA